jgi:hypothetical protein
VIDRSGDTEITGDVDVTAIVEVTGTIEIEDAMRGRRISFLSRRWKAAGRWRSKDDRAAVAGCRAYRPSLR